MSKANSPNRIAPSSQIVLEYSVASKLSHGQRGNDRIPQITSIKEKDDRKKTRQHHILTELSPQIKSTNKNGDLEVSQPTYQDIRYPRRKRRPQ